LANLDVYRGAERERLEFDDTTGTTTTTIVISTTATTTGNHQRAE
jgi:hypothetical protein